MEEIGPGTEAAIRIGSFLSVLALLAIWERSAPRRSRQFPRRRRWSSNFGLVALNTLIVRLVVPVTAVAAAVFAAGRNWGLLHLVDWPPWIEIPLAVLIFDLAIYLQHVMFHAVPLFWRLHRVHHADPEFDLSTGVRFHTFEILLSAFIKLGVVFVLGPAAVAVVLFEVLLNATSMFNHSNIRLPLRVDNWLRWLVVTPDMHRVHHSIRPHETNSNFGFNLPWWDHLLGTYRSQPAAGHEKMQIGLEGLTDERDIVRFWGVLRLPFGTSQQPRDQYPINRRPYTPPDRDGDAPGS